VIPPQKCFPSPLESYARRPIKKKANGKSLLIIVLVFILFFYKHIKELLINLVFEMTTLKKKKVEESYILKHTD
jgi:hypothetical protein